MKSSGRFRDVIKTYLDKYAESHNDFAEAYKKEGKTIEGCVNHIYALVKKACPQGGGFDDDEVYEMARSYYISENVEKYVGSMNVVVNHHVDLTEEEKAEARQKAIDKAIEEQKALLNKPKKTMATNELQPSLF